MSRKSGTLPIDQNRNPFGTTLTTKKAVTFDGGTENGIGNDGGTQDPYTLFTVTGTVAVKCFAKCTASLAGDAGTLAVGTVVSPTGLITTTTATDIDVNEIWHDATPDASIELSSIATEKIVSADIVLTTATADVTGGSIEVYCIWYPLSPDGNITAA